MAKIEKLKKTAKRIWNFLVHEDSWASFVADLIIIIIFAKFILYPAIGLALGTSYPIVAVVSDSMDHDNKDFDTWWEEKGGFYEELNISKTEFRKFFLADGFKKGDVLIIKGKPPNELKVGDVVVFSEKSRSNPIIHRIVAIEGEGVYSIKGDANSVQLDFEKGVRYENIEGKGLFMLPKIGWVKVGVVELFNYLSNLL